MDIPRPITVVPQSRRYTRRFMSDQAKTFYEGDTVYIQIPPIDRGYLTKNQKLHFTVDLEFLAMSQQKYATMLWDMVNENKCITFLQGGNVNLTQPESDWLNAVVQKMGIHSPLNAYFNVVPAMDINGPYGFIESIQVRDFLGGTVLEDIPNHHLLTAQFADIWFKHENLYPYRPRCTDPTTNLVRKASSISLDGPSFPFDIDDPLPATINVTTAGITVTPITDKLSMEFNIDLYSMLHKLSSAFVPLHNGFTLAFKLRNNITFETVLPNKNIVYKRNISLTYPCGFVTADPSITSFSVSSIYLQTEILELSPELDQQVDKIIHYQGWKYQQNYLPALTGKRALYTQRLYPELKSVNRVYIGQRKQLTDYPSIRVRNNVVEAELQYNKAVVNSCHSLSEFEAAWSREKPDEYLSTADFSANLDYTGPRLFFSPYLLVSGQTVMTAVGVYPGSAGINASLTTARLEPGGYLNWDYNDTGLNLQGRFLIIFDCKIPSTSEEVVAGVDTTRNALEYQITFGTATNQNVALDCFILHDAVVTVVPGKHTDVSF